MNTYILVVDTETGGLDPQVNSILTIGLVMRKDGAEMGRKLIKVAEDDIVAEERALQVNGIDIDALRRDGISPAAAVVEIEEFIRANGSYPAGVVVAGHNIPFDVGFLQRLYRLAGVKYPFRYRVLDTVSLAYAMQLAGRLPNLKSVSLDALAARFGITIRTGTTHDALEDAVATSAVLSALVRLLVDPARALVEAPPTELVNRFTAQLLTQEGWSEEMRQQAIGAMLFAFGNPDQ